MRRTAVAVAIAVVAALTTAVLPARPAAATFDSYFNCPIGTHVSSWGAGVGASPTDVIVCARVHPLNRYEITNKLATYQTVAPGLVFLVAGDTVAACEYHIPDPGPKVCGVLSGGAAAGTTGDVTWAAPSARVCEYRDPAPFESCIWVLGAFYIDGPSGPTFAVGGAAAVCSDHLAICLPDYFGPSIGLSIDLAPYRDELRRLLCEVTCIEAATRSS